MIKKPVIVLAAFVVVVLIVLGANLLFNGFAAFVGGKNSSVVGDSSSALVDESPSEEAKFLAAVNALKASREALVAAIDAEDYVRVSEAAIEYNRTVYGVSAALVAGCADPEIGKKYGDICMNPVLLNECNMKDAQITYMMMRLDYVPENMSAEECYDTIDMLRKQEKCAVVGEGYTAPEEIMVELESICGGL